MFLCFNFPPALTPLRCLLPLIAVCFMTFSATSQTTAYKEAANSFEKWYNASQYDSIFMSFSIPFQEVFPKTKTLAFLTKLKSQAGEIRTKEFYRQSDKNASFKATCEYAVVLLSLSLDTDKKVSGLLVKPFQENSSGTKDVVNVLQGMPRSQVELIGRMVQPFPANTQISIALLSAGKKQFYGILKTNDSLVSISNQKQIFEIGSLTKVFTSTLLAEAVLAGKVKLDDKINGYYPFSFHENLSLDFMGLVTHTSGLPALPSNLSQHSKTLSNPYALYDSSKLYSYLQRDVQLDTTVGVFSYSNLGFGLLGYTLGLVQHTTYEALLKNQIFEKYRMSHSYAGRSQKTAAMVQGLGRNGKPVSGWDFDVLAGAGSMLSCTADLAIFLEAQMKPENKSMEMTREQKFIVSDDRRMGMGWHILKSKSGMDWYWHNGGTGGFSSSMIVDTETKTAVVILSNISTFNPSMNNIDALAFEMMQNQQPTKLK